MAVAKKLDVLTTAQIVNIVERRRALSRMITRLQQEKAQLPGKNRLAKIHQVSYQTIHRAVSR